MAMKIKASAIKLGDIILSKDGYDWTVKGIDEEEAFPKEAGEPHVRFHLREMKSKLLLPSESLVDVVRPSSIPVLTSEQIIELWRNLEHIYDEGWVPKEGAPQWVKEYNWDLFENTAFQMFVTTAESELEMISEEYWEAVRDLSNLRCLYCSQPYGERDEITCRIEGTAHTYDAYDVETHQQIVAGIEPRYKNAKSDYCERKVKFNHEVKHCAGVHDWRHADYGDGIIGHVCAKCPEMRGPFKSTLEVK